MYENFTTSILDPRADGARAGGGTGAFIYVTHKADIFPFGVEARPLPLRRSDATHDAASACPLGRDGLLQPGDSLLVHLAEVTELHA